MRRNQTSTVVLMAVVALISALYLALPSDPVSSTLQRFAFGIDNTFSSSQSGEEIATSNQHAELVAENERLKELLSFHSPSTADYTAARVASKNVQNYRSTIDISVGADNGIEVGQPVASNGQLIGRVIEVSTNRARIITLSDPDFRAAALIEGTDIDGLVSHVAGGTVLEQVPSEIAAEHIGKRVVTSGLGGVFPPGLFIGRLGDDVSPDNAIFKEFVLESTIDLATVQEVVVLQ